MRSRLQIAKLCLVLFLGTAGTSAQVKLQGSALERLSNAKVFAMGPVGFAYKTSQEEIDYRLILGQPTALVSFEKLYAEGNMQAKSYALTAIRQLSPERFRELYESLPNSNDKVRTMNGCILSDETLRDVAQGLAASPDPGK
ncbi:MAG TPA: hypothetical protein VNW54_04805 [Granulicella sp.]|jgi:hypothetical protein|nr:hypothetical protein [Granulicella sp.]